MKLNKNELETLLRLAWQMKESAEFESVPDGQLGATAPLEKHAGAEAPTASAASRSDKAVDLRSDAARLYGMAIAHIENGEILHDDVAQ